MCYTLIDPPPPLVIFICPQTGWWGRVCVCVLFQTTRFDKHFPFLNQNNFSFLRMPCRESPMEPQIWIKALFTSWLIILYACTLLTVFYVDSKESFQVMNLHKLHLELLCYIGDVNKSKPVYEKEKLYTSKGTNIIYFGGKNFSS